MTIDNIEATVLGCASGVDGWTTIKGPMSLAARSLGNRGFVEVLNDNAPETIED